MIVAGVFLAILVGFVLEAVVLWVDQIHRNRAEAAYWQAKRGAPDLYDWSREPDL